MTQPCNEHPTLAELKERLTETMGVLIRKGQWGEVSRLSETLTRLEKDASSIDCDELIELLNRQMPSGSKDV